MKRAIGLILVLTSAMIGCTSNIESYDFKHASYSSTAFIDKNYQAADALAAQLSSKLISKEPIISTTLVNMDNLAKTSTFGRLVSEQVSARLAEKNFNLIEVKVRDNLLIKENQGEFLLTRELSKLAKSHNAQAVMVGTYTETGTEVYVNLKVIQANTNSVLAASSHAFPKAKNIRSMLLEN